MSHAATAAERAVADAHRTEWAYVLAATVRVTRDLDAAQDCVQDAYVAALDAWARDGVPERPGAWLTTVARRGALNVLARGRTLAAKLPLLVEPAGAEDDGHDPDAIPDDRLRLVFICCHPALAPEAQVALTLRLVCGVATPDIAAAFLVSEPAMAARITRAKKKIAAAGIPYAVPPRAERPARLDAVLTVVHLLSATGHTAPSGDALVRADLAERALDLARMLYVLLPAEPEVAGLLALLLVHRARQDGRADAAGNIIRLEDQDRATWDRALIAEADRLVVGALSGEGAPGRYALQAAIAALHAAAPAYAQTDWPQILTLYDALLAVWPSPVVALNRAVALAMVDGPDAGLAAIAALEDDGRLAGYRYLPATKADLLSRLGRHEEAASAYRSALALTASGPERSYLAQRLG
ncbi:MAG TPA: DUF6596 domain-containing protein [Baekduia sp.]